MTAPSRNIAALDVPLSTLHQQIADLIARQRQQVEEANTVRGAERLRWLLAHPEAAADGKPCSDGEAAEYRHLLTTADADDTTRPFVDLRKGRKL